MKKIFIIDDESYIIDSLTRLLKKEGYDTFGTTNPMEGIVEVRKLRPDLIIIDLKMPSMSGFDIVQEIRKDKILEKIPIIVLTGSQELQTIVKLRQLGVADYIVKPYYRDDLINRVKKALGDIKQNPEEKKCDKLHEKKEQENKPVIGEVNVLKKIPIEEVEPEMVLGTNVKTKSQSILLARGTTLTNDIIKKLKKQNIPSVEITVDKI